MSQRCTPHASLVEGVLLFDGAAAVPRVLEPVYEALR
jgi:hypothetical protein